MFYTSRGNARDRKRGSGVRRRSVWLPSQQQGTGEVDLEDLDKDQNTFDKNNNQALAKVLKE